MSKPQEKCVVFTAIRGFALTRSRLRIIEHFLAEGWRVIAATVLDKHVIQLTNIGVLVVPVPFQRGGLSAIRDFQALGTLMRIYSHYKPDLIHHFQAKPIIVGNLAAMFVPKSKVANTITGLGHAFIHGGLNQQLASLGYRLAVRRSDITVFQNPDDRQLFVDKGWLSLKKSGLILSSGVDISLFYPRRKESNNRTLKVLMVGRLLWEKGVREFVEAAEIVHKSHPNVCFQLGGELDPKHPDAVPEAWVNQVEKTHVINYLRYIHDMPSQLRDSDIFVLPSYYREGIPRVLLEAASCGLPMITCDTPGCRETVVHGETGFLIPPQDSEALANAVIQLINDPDLRTRMGLEGRKRVENHFDTRIITEEYLEVYRGIGVDI